MIVQNPLIRNIRFEGLVRDISGFYHYHYPNFFLTYCWGWIFNFGGLNHIHFHFISYLLQATCSALLFLFLLKITRREWLSFFSTLIFALHPLHCEAANWISRQGMLLMVLFGLLYLHASLSRVRTYRISRLLFLALSVIISPVSILFIFAAFLLFSESKEGASIKSDGIIAFVIVFALWGWKMHLSLFHSLTLQAPLATLFMIKSFLMPWDIHFLIPAFSPLPGVLTILSYGLMIVVGLLFLRYRQRSWGLLFLAFVSVWLLHANTPRFNGAWSYPALFWIALAVGTGLSKYKPVQNGVKALSLVLPVLLLASWGILSYRRNMDWRNTAALVRDTLHVSPNDPLVRAMEGHYEAAMMNPQAAKAAFQAIHSPTPVTECLKAKSMHLLLQFRAASEDFKTLFSHFPEKRSDKYCLFDDAVLENQTGHPKETEKLLKKITKMDPFFIYAWNDLGALMIREGKWKNAIFYLRKALTVAPSYRPSLENMAYLYMKEKVFRQAIPYLKIAFASTSCKDTQAFYKEWIRTLKKKKGFRMATIQWAKLTPPG